MTFVRFVVVAGLSGAGKSRAMKSLEDLGYSCLDNVSPARALERVERAHDAGVERLALSLEMRKQGPLGEPLAALRALRESASNVEVLFLEAGDDALVRSECEELRALREAATLVLDPAALSPAELESRIAAAYGDEPHSAPLAIHLIAFGYKFGPPPEADLVLDVRFLPNPYYVPELRERCGTDAPVAAFLDAQPEAQGFLRRLESLLDFLVPLYVTERKSRLTIAFGCTGGQHRSVYLAERVAAYLRRRAGLSVTVERRELAAV